MKLIKEKINQRYYEVDFKIKNCFGICKTIKELFDGEELKFKDEYELAEDVSEYINKVYKGGVDKEVLSAKALEILQKVKQSS